MSAAHAPTLADAELLAAAEQACARIAPSWPLDRLIAVNPWWGWRDTDFARTGSQLQALCGSPLHMPLAYYRERLAAGEIDAAALAAAAREADFPGGATALLNAGDTGAAAPLPLLSDLLDAAPRAGAAAPLWRETITHQIGQCCAAWFDQGEAEWQPVRAANLYAHWLATLRDDHSVALLMHAPEIRVRAQALPDTPTALLAALAGRLGLTAEGVARLCLRALLAIGGWAAWCAWQRWQARLDGTDDAQILDLLAVRLGWECLLDDGQRDADSPFVRWQAALRAPVPTDHRIDAASVWQRAQEMSYQRGLANALAQTPEAPPTGVPAVQAVFCIDVRSEVFRRALEASAPAIETRGFAGFFGLPIAYRPLGTEATWPQLPGLLAPSQTVTDSTGLAAEDRLLAAQRQERLAADAGAEPFRRLPASAFARVETLGLGYLGHLLQQSLGLGQAAGPAGLSAAQAHSLRPVLALPPAERSALAAGILNAMSLRQGFAPLVLLAGHGSETRNNAHAAGLDCGACCGQTGEVNARVLAELLNDPAVRSGLLEHGIVLPASTWFIAALHHTTTDRVTLFDRERAPAAVQPALAALTQALARAGELAWAERAPALGLGALRHDAAALAAAVDKKSRNWAETRPEWGLANNAAFIIAPRARTRGLDLGGRSFLHDYDYRQDPDGAVLTLLMTAPMVVTNWINLQYYGSTVDPQRYGSGNKLLHNVVGGNIGVFEGNGGDLRIGLPLQSLHDGAQWRHAPLRLSVFIDAPQEAIDRVIAEHPVVAQLVDNHWLYLFRLGESGIEFRTTDSWSEFEHAHE